MTTTPLSLTGLQLTFDDEFNSFTSTPSGVTGWATTYPFGGETARTLPANHEAEYYSDSSVGVNPFSISNGVLDITAAPAAAGSNPYGLTYTSGVITSVHSFAQLYGYFEMRAELPAGQGLWPAFWMLPVDQSYATELDVMEQLGNNATTIYSTVHDNAGGADGGMNVVQTPNVTTGFHTYGVDWEPNTITFYVDGKITATMVTPAAMNKPMFMLANLAVGAAGSWPGAASFTTPAVMQVDYIRAYATAATAGVSGTAAITTGAVAGQVLLAGAAQAGVTVSLVNAHGVVVATATSSSTGAFAFTGIQNGGYQVQYTLANGQTLVAAAPISIGQTTTIGGSGFMAAASFTGSVLTAGVAVAGAVVTLVNASGAVVSTTTTSATGAYSFGSVLAGTYQIGYAAPNGTVLAPGSQATIGTGLTAAIAIATGQSIALPTEVLLPASSVSGSVLLNGVTASAGVAVSLLNAAGTVIATTTSSSTGAYGFANLEAGAYQVKIAAPSGQFLQTGSQVSTVTGLTPALTLAVGQSLVLGAENLLTVPASASGTIHHYGAATDPSWGTSQAGVTVALVNSAGVTIASTVTGGSGWFNFNNLAAGSYQYRFTPPAGMVLKAGGIANTTTGLTSAFTLTAGQTFSGVIAAVVSCAGITGQVVQSGVGDAGVVVSLVNATGATIATTTSGSTGSFAFNNLLAGSYQVQYTAPSGQSLSPTGAANASTGLTAPVTVALGQTVALASETMIPAGILGGSVVYAGAPQAGVSVSLLNAAGTSVGATTTDANGAFHFAGLAAGSYQIQYTPPAGEMLQAGSVANTTTGLSAPVVLSAGQAITLAAETMVPAPAAVTGSVLHDGVTEAGVSVSLLNGAGAVVASALTNAAGNYSFGGLTAGNYQVSFAAPRGQSLQTGGLAGTNGVSATVSVAAGQILALAPENLLSTPASIQGSVNHLGIADPSWGSGQSGVGVALLNSAGAVIATTVSGGNGYYAFGNLAAGSYQLQYTPPAGEALRAGGIANTATGLTAQLTVANGQKLWMGVGTVVSSSNTFSLTGNGAIALRGAGNFTVTGAASNSILSLGAGNQNVALVGTGDRITIGAGNSTVNAGSGGAVVHAAGGNVTITAGGANNLFDAGRGIGFLNSDGSAGNVFMLNTAAQGMTTVAGFNGATTDVLDLARTLAGTSILPDLSNVGSYVTASVANGNTTLYVDPTGSNAAPSAFAVLTGVNTSVTQLLAGHHLSMA